MTGSPSMRIIRTGYREERFQDITVEIALNVVCGMLLWCVSLVTELIRGRRMGVKEVEHLT